MTPIGERPRNRFAAGTFRRGARESRGSAQERRCERSGDALRRQPWCWGWRWPVPAPGRVVWRHAARRSNWRTPPEIRRRKRTRCWPRRKRLWPPAIARLPRNTQAARAPISNRPRSRSRCGARACCCCDPARRMARSPPQAAAALGELKASWPAEDFRSYLNRPVIRRMYAVLLHVAPAAPAPNRKG